MWGHQLVSWHRWMIKEINFALLWLHWWRTECLAGGKKTRAAWVMSCLWASELCDSEANSPSAGRISTCDFDIRPVLNRTVSKTFLTCTDGTQGRPLKNNWVGIVPRENGNPRGMLEFQDSCRLPAPALVLQGSDCIQAADWCRVGFLRMCIYAEEGEHGLSRMSGLLSSLHS